MKKFFTTILLFLLLLQSAGMLLVFLYSNYSHKRGMREFLSGNINEKNLELIKLSFLTAKSDYNFQRLDDYEIALGAKRYDVFKEKVRGDTVYFYCLRDEKEEEIYSRLNSFLMNRINARIPKANIVSQLLTVAAIYYSSDKPRDTHLFSSPKSYYSSHVLYRSVILDKDSPPPRMS